MRSIRLTLALLILLVSAGKIYAQAGATGTILGTITDSTGAALPGVDVTVTNTGTNVPYKTVSSSAGDFNAPALQPGSYTVTATAPGFQKAVTKPFILTVDQKLRVDLSLKPGQVSETMEVTAQA
ncbi:MAG TPA: carboxypeptidase-like regulatory domain-containing protein, partial [Acidobacteriaceae bacterium]|nr:carboxypeptidase-like regulatory domain-containing protein [Acidobacteriaceae bacterium]